MNQTAFEYGNAANPTPWSNTLWANTPGWGSGVAQDFLDEKPEHEEGSEEEIETNEEEEK